MFICFGQLLRHPNVYIETAKGFSVIEPRTWALSLTFTGFSFSSYVALRLSTNTLSAKGVLKFRDDVSSMRFRNPGYWNLFEKGIEQLQRENVDQMARVKLKWQLLKD